MLLQTQTFTKKIFPSSFQKTLSLSQFPKSNLQNQKHAIRPNKNQVKNYAHKQFVAAFPYFGVGPIEN
jgi:hypothetical protein